MTKFERMRHSADMMESACEAILDKAYATVRWDRNYQIQSDEEFNKLDDRQLYEHLNDDGLEVIQLAHDLVDKLENAF